MTKFNRPFKYAKNIREIVQDRSVLTFKITDTIPKILKDMCRDGIAAGAVINPDKKFIGFITEREVVRKIYGDSNHLQERLDILSKEGNSKNLTAWDVMITNPDNLNPDDNIDDAHDIITYFKYRYMPVVDRDQKFHGVIDARELHQHVYAKSQDIMQSKDSLLSYFMGNEPYGIGASL